MHPYPPDLKKVAADLSPAQLFWIVKNGINMTGMPSFAEAGATDNEIWSIAAFVKKLPAFPTPTTRAGQQGLNQSSIRLL